jgi:anti-sigma factor RsiW
MHPSEIELLELVEGDLDEPGAASASAHVEGCDACRAELALLETGRSALRSSPLLELPAGRLESMLAALPAQDREPRRLGSILRSPRRLAIALVPVTAIVVAAVVGITATTGDGQRDTAAAGEAASTAAVMAEAAEAEAAAGAEEAPPPEGATADGAPWLESEATSPASEKAPAVPPFLVAGPVEEVVRLLEEAGFEISVSGLRVTVRGAEAEAVARALESRSAGTVEVVVSAG